MAITSSSIIPSTRAACERLCPCPQQGSIRKKANLQTRICSTDQKKKKAQKCEQLRHQCLSQPRGGGQGRLHKGGNTWEKSKDEQRLSGGCVGNSTAGRWNSMCEGRERERAWLELPRPRCGAWGVGDDNSEHCGRKETPVGILDWKAGLEASSSPGPQTIRQHGAWGRRQL